MSFSPDKHIRKNEDHRTAAGSARLNDRSSFDHTQIGFCFDKSRAWFLVTNVKAKEEMVNEVERKKRAETCCKFRTFLVQGLWIEQLFILRPRQSCGDISS